ncbi:ubiquitin [Cystoisospora suis]|uniref:Ubiquitin n=1 Tax=Cystoisospora suis TaxID=483139 RepID=A0A2C6L1T0_9APIC|nr:ubiquitin [Cystoisospora suis]
MTTCTVVITDFSGGRQGEDKDKVTLESVDMGVTISELKQLIGNRRRELKPEKIILYMGKLLLDDQRKLQSYNKSKRAKLSLEMYDLVEIKVFVKTLQHCGSGGCVMVPMWAICCQQKFVVSIPDHETVGTLRRRTCEEIADPENYPLDKIKLSFNRRLLVDDSEEIRSLGIKEGSTVTLLVRLCYFNKKKAAEEAEKKQSQEPPAEHAEAGDTTGENQAPECPGPAENEGVSLHSNASLGEPGATPSS